MRETTIGCVMFHVYSSFLRPRCDRARLLVLDGAPVRKIAHNCERSPTHRIVEGAHNQRR